MLLTPSLSPRDSPSTTTSPPPLQPPPAVQPPLPPPVVSPAFPPTNAAPPLVPISTIVSTPPPILLPVVSPPPPAAIATSPFTPPLPPLPLVFTFPPPPPSPSPAITPISPVASPPYLPPPALIIPSPTHPPPPALAIPSAPLPTSTPPAVPPRQPLTSLPSTSPLPSPTPPTPASVILPPASSLPPPTDPPPLTFFVSPPPPAASHSIPNTPVSSQPFFPLSTPPPSSLPLAVGKGGLPATKQGSHSPIGLIVACISVGILLFVVLALVCICCKTRSRKQKPSHYNRKQQCWVPKAPNRPEPEEVAPPGAHVIEVQPKALPPPAKGSGSNNSCLELNPSSGIFTYDELVVATNGFSESNLLGQGGFGYVHKGVLRNGQEVAVKQLKAGSQQGEREFQAEVETISRVHHKHLVSLVGYCINGDQRLLVYEFVPNKTLEFHLHGNGQPVIAWESRLKIAIGSAKGIAYLHEDCSPTIIHRDIKASNILLDPRFEAKVSDFGLAKIFFDASSSITHISTRVVGTFGYLAPEYVLTGKLTDKSDVYSYGVMLLELITGRPPIIEKESSINQSLVDWARPLLARALEDHDFNALADPRLQGVYDKNEMASMVSCAAACVRQSAWLRPRMIQVVRALEGDISLPYIDKGTSSWNSLMCLSSENPIQNSQRHENTNMALAS
ncbi:hypothetical protein PTKIN_Ptkin19aG0112000 [Pterospermum kingtungense]